MSTTTIQGKKVPLYFSFDNGATYKRTVCIKSWDLSVQTAINKENTQCGVFVGLGPNDWSFSFDCLANATPAVGECSYSDLLLAVNNQTRLLIKTVYPDYGNGSSGTELHIELPGYLSNLSTKVQVGNLVTFTATFNGDGNPTFLL